jgi:hypothetical protein
MMHLGRLRALKTAFCGSGCWFVGAEKGTALLHLADVVSPRLNLELSGADCFSAGKRQQAQGGVGVNSLKPLLCRPYKTYFYSTSEQCLCCPPPLQASVSRRKEVCGLASMIRHFHMADVGEEDTVFDCRSFLL